MSGWEIVECGDEDRELTTRLRVPGGWIYMHKDWVWGDGDDTGGERQMCQSMVFVPAREVSE